MKRRLFSLMVAVIIIAGNNSLSFSQDTDTVRYWKKGGVFSLNIAQSSFTNWAAGGQNSVALNGLINLNANFKKDKHSWDNTLDIGYGKMQQKGNDLGWVKTDDKIDLLSKYGYQASKFWYYAGLVSFKTQMAPGYNYPNTDTRISDLFSPAYLLFSLGMDYKPGPVFSAYISPLTVKTTIVNDKVLSAAGAFGVEPGKKLRGELGAYANILFKKDEVVKNVRFQSKLDLFSNYLHNPQNVDVSWENLVVMKVNKFLSATITTNILYDDDILVKVGEGTEGDPIMGKRVQFKEVIGVGFTYKLVK